MVSLDSTRNPCKKNDSILSSHTYVLRVLLCSPFLFFRGMTFKMLHPKGAKQYFSGKGEGWRAKVLPKKTFQEHAPDNYLCTEN